jgi:hypothetical protein
MDRYVRTVLNRGADLSIGDMRAVSRLLQFGGSDVAVALERAEQVRSWRRRRSESASRSRAAGRAAAHEPGQDRRAGELGGAARQRGAAGPAARVAIQERALPGGASDRDLRRLAAPAVEFAAHVPALARALELGVRDSLASGLMLVPRVADERNASKLLWVPDGARGRGSQHGPAVVRQHASAVAQAAAGVAPGVSTALTALSQDRPDHVDAASKAAAQARSYAGGARAQLREILSRQAASLPPPLSFPLPAHPRLAPDGPVSGRGR